MGGQEQVFIQKTFNTNWITTVWHDLGAFEKEVEAYMLWC
jgi:hypothetical protein